MEAPTRHQHEGLHRGRGSRGREKRNPESEEFIIPQRAHADIVIRFAPIEERGETADDPLSATLLLRPTISHPDLPAILGEDTREAIPLKLTRDDDGKPVCRPATGGSLWVLATATVTAAEPALESPTSSIRPLTLV